MHVNKGGFLIICSKVSFLGEIDVFTTFCLLFDCKTFERDYTENFDGFLLVSKLVM